VHQWSLASCPGTGTQINGVSGHLLIDTEAENGTFLFPYIMRYEDRTFCDIVTGKPLNKGDKNDGKFDSGQRAGDKKASQYH
jgi:hypothetical protein